ncbi:MAG TPA: TetR/AcrR family transcriptional regulator [Solirubrobacteraceae bacterium]|nr:TetR/AcrR family transcriptional regulator [Solirubrobacteraceae bacterium]
MPQARDHRRAAAEHSIESILNAAETLLARGDPVTTTAVAAESGVSRVTVYSHFPTQEAMLEAVAARVVDRFAARLGEIDLDSGSAPAALDRLIAAAWAELDRYDAIAAAVARQLSAERLRRSHAALQRPIVALIERGRAEGSFRTDLPADWLLASYFALVHAGGEEVNAGRLGPGEATAILQTSVKDLFTAVPGARPA